MGMFNIEVTGPATETGSFITPADGGTLFVHCGVPEHEAKGMIAQIKIGEGGEDLPNIPGITNSIEKSKDFFGMNILYVLAFVSVGLGLFGGFLIQRKRTQ